jgi:SSS family solute:Na+ symporter
MHMVRPKRTEIPWTALLIGLWIPNFFYWGLNQYIVQRTLGSKSLAEGQKGVVFAAFLKLIIPFVVVIPGILAFNLFNSDLRDDAVNRNARIIAENSPELYGRLSDGVKPNPEDPRNKNIIENIEVLLKSDDRPAVPMAYTFDEEFAALHPAAAWRIAEHNLQVAGQETDDMPPADENPPTDEESLAKLVAGNASVVADAKAALGEGLAAETLEAHDYDNAFPTLIRRLVPIGNGIKGFVLAAIFGAVVSSLASMLNSASTIATMDIYNKLRHAFTGSDGSQYELVTTGRVFVVVFVLVAMVIAPYLGHPAFGGIFTFIQEFQGFISPGILAIFIFGLLIHRAPRYVGTVGLLLNPVLYGLFKFSPRLFGEANPAFLAAIAKWSFLDRMALCFGLVVAVLTLLTLINPLKQPVNLPVNEEMNIEQSRGALYFGLLVCVLTVALYIVFW